MKNWQHKNKWRYWLQHSILPILGLLLFLAVPKTWLVATINQAIDHSITIELVKHVIDQMKPAEETVGQLVRKLGKPLKEQSFTPVKEKPEPKSKQSGGIPTRPKAGTMTARVWEAADWLYSQQESKDCNAKSLRDEVVKVCVDNGVNGSTASTQFAKWKKALNAG